MRSAKGHSAMFKVKKLDIFIIRQFGLLFIGTFFICQFVLMMQFLWQYVDKLIGKGLSMDVLAQFFWYMGLMLVPQALPLAILLSSLITFGNLGESSELTAIKASGISLMQVFKPLIVVVCFITLLSFEFQNKIGPNANVKLTQIMISMRQKSPELEIPEGIFYDGIPQANIYVQKKDLNTGKLYGIMIYQMTGSYEDQAIILADSGMLQSTAEKKHLLLTLWSGEWFENMQTSQLGSSAAVPYRRETFAHKRILINYDNDFNLADASSISTRAKAKSIAQLRVGYDSLAHVYDSVGRAYFHDEQMFLYRKPHLQRKDSLLAVKSAAKMNVDSAFAHLAPERKLQVVNSAMSTVQSAVSEHDFKSLVTSDGDRYMREHIIEQINKYTTALTCLIFFFIGAPLGAIIRKGGLGIPVIISVLVFIIYYILDNTGYRMARMGLWTIPFGKSLAPAILIPLAGFVTYKANNDSVVFNLDLYRDLFRRMFGLRLKRSVMGKEVIIQDPHYAEDAERLRQMNEQVVDYVQTHRLMRAPNPIKVFFKYHPDHKIERISEELEQIIEDLNNTRSRKILTYLNQYPVLAVKAHTRPFERRWMNSLAAVIVPLGLFFYFRMWGFRLRLLKDLRVIRQTNNQIIEVIDKRLQQSPEPTEPTPPTI